jgi:mono/diheme cytochrome c family protein
MKIIIIGALTLILLAAVPPAIVAHMRAVPNETRRIHIIQDMDNQHRIKAQAPSPTFHVPGVEQPVSMFIDNRGMRPQVDGTVARGELFGDDHFDRGVVSGGDGLEWAATFPDNITVNEALIRRGQERFGIYCMPCHGAAGYGDGLVHQRANKLMMAGVNGTVWVQPKSLHEELIRAQPVGQIFNSITNGVRNMAGYEAQIPTADRWAIVAWVKTLQRSQHASPNDLTASERASLETVTSTQIVEEAAGSADGNP